MKTPSMTIATAVLLSAPIAAAQPGSPDPLPTHVIGLTEATRGLKAQGPLVARLDIEHGGKAVGSFTCELFDKQAPKTVANFVGLARGLRPFWDERKKAWEKRAFYDGLVFHAVVPEFMIQGGDPRGLGTGTPGYTFEDEIVEGLRMDRAGMLAMASAGPGTNGSQFFITEKAMPHLDGQRTIFGACQPADLVATLARMPVGVRNLPLDPIVIKRVTISRGASVAAKKPR